MKLPILAYTVQHDQNINPYLKISIDLVEMDNLIMYHINYIRYPYTHLLRVLNKKQFSVKSAKNFSQSISIVCLGNDILKDSYLKE